MHTHPFRFNRVLNFSSLVAFIVLIASPALAQEADAGPPLIDHLWLIVCAALVFFMQAGFLCFEVGAVQSKSVTAVAMKNLVDWIMASAGFFLVGFALMFGTDIGGFIGSSLWALEGVEGNGLGYTFFFFQLVFAGTALTIVSGAMSERTGFVTYLLVSLIMGLVIYPVFGHWVWGSGFIADNTPWLAGLGFIDFAGSSVVHMVGAGVAAVGVMMLGPRLGRYDADGNLVELKAHSFPFAGLGVIILWFGWIGFNGGSELAFNDAVPRIIVATNIAAAFAGIAGFAHCWFFQNKANINEKFLGSILGGLVAITACCHLVTPLVAAVIGMLAGVVHNLSFDLVIKRWKLDDPVGAIPVHGFCGAFGILCVALFGNADMLAHPRLVQLGVQIIGIVACVAWSMGAAYIMFATLRKFVGLRVSFEEEYAGIHIGGEPPKVEQQKLSADDLSDLM